VTLTLCRGSLTLACAGGERYKSVVKERARETQTDPGVREDNENEKKTTTEIHIEEKFTQLLKRLEKKFI
jgi:hypothetical protein